MYTLTFAERRKQEEQTTPVAFVFEEKYPKTDKKYKMWVMANPKKGFCHFDILFMTYMSNMCKELLSLPHTDILLKSDRAKIIRKLRLYRDLILLRAEYTKIEQSKIVFQERTYEEGCIKQLTIMNDHCLEIETMEAEFNKKLEALSAAFPDYKQCIPFGFLMPSLVKLVLTDSWSIIDESSEAPESLTFTLSKLLAQDKLTMYYIPSE